jgi:hypothetical protein
MKTHILLRTLFLIPAFFWLRPVVVSSIAATGEAAQVVVFSISYPAWHILVYLLAAIYMACIVVTAAGCAVILYERRRYRR